MEFQLQNYHGLAQRAIFANVPRSLLALDKFSFDGFPRSPLVGEGPTCSHGLTPQVLFPYPYPLPLLYIYNQPNVDAHPYTTEPPTTEARSADPFTYPYPPSYPHGLHTLILPVPCSSSVCSSLLCSPYVPSHLGAFLSHMEPLSLLMLSRAL